MHIGNRAILAVECMAWLNSCSRVRPGKTLWLANCIQRSVSYTESLLARLREAGLIAAKKGAGGGYYLVRPAEEISIADILAVFDDAELEIAADEDLDPAAVDEPGSSVDALCNALSAQTRQFLSEISLADVGERARPAQRVTPIGRQAPELVEPCRPR